MFYKVSKKTDEKNKLAANVLLEFVCSRCTANMKWL